MYRGETGVHPATQVNRYSTWPGHVGVPSRVRLYMAPARGLLPSFVQRISFTDAWHSDVKGVDKSFFVYPKSSSMYSLTSMVPFVEDIGSGNSTKYLSDWPRNIELSPAAAAAVNKTATTARVML